MINDTEMMTTSKNALLVLDLSRPCIVPQAAERKTQPAHLAIGLKRFVIRLDPVQLSHVKNANFGRHFFLRVHLFSFR